MEEKPTPMPGLRPEPWPPAFALAAACCRPPGEARNAAVRAAAALGIAGDRLLGVMGRHRIEGLALEALGRAGVALEPATAARLRALSERHALEGLGQAAESARLQRLLDQAGIANLVLKGATLDILAWGRPGLKRSWDIDLMVAPSDAPRAKGVLEAAGYDLGAPAHTDDRGFARWVTLTKEAAFQKRDGPGVVELHWRAVDTATLLPGLSAHSPSQAVAMAGGLTLRTFAPDELFAYLCVHGATHAWSRLKWLADVGALLAQETEEGRARLHDRAIALGAGRCPTVAMMLCDHVLGVPMPPEVARTVRGDHKAGRLEALALDAMAGAGDTEIVDRPMAEDRILLSQFLFADGWRFWWAEWRRQWVSIDDRMRMPLPPALGFIYVLIRGPLWLARRLRRS